MKPTSDSIASGLSKEQRQNQTAVGLGGPYNSQMKKIVAFCTRHLNLNNMCCKTRLTLTTFTLLKPDMFADSKHIGLQYYGKDKNVTGVCNNWTQWIWGAPKRNLEPCWHKKRDFTAWYPLYYIPALMWVNWSVVDTKKWNSVVKGYNDLENERQEFYKSPQMENLTAAERKEKWEEKNLRKVVKWYYNHEPDFVGQEVFILLVLVVLFFHIEIIPYWFALNQAAKTETYDETKHKIKINFQAKDVIAEKFGLQYFGSSRWDMVFRAGGMKVYVILSIMC